MNKEKKSELFVAFFVCVYAKDFSNYKTVIVGSGINSNIKPQLVSVVAKWLIIIAAAH